MSVIKECKWMGNRLNTIKRKNELYSEEDFFNFFTSMNGLEGMTVNFDEEEKVIKFYYKDETYALLLKREKLSLNDNDCENKKKIIVSKRKDSLIVLLNYIIKNTADI